MWQLTSSFGTDSRFYARKRLILYNKLRLRRMTTLQATCLSERTCLLVTQHLIPTGKGPIKNLKNRNFATVDNPERWLKYFFRPKFTIMSEKTQKYLENHLSIGVKPFPFNTATDKREIQGWKFEYNKWYGGTNSPSSADNVIPFAKERVGLLDYQMFLSPGVTFQPILLVDALLFYYLLLRFDAFSLNTLLSN